MSFTHLQSQNEFLGRRVSGIGRSKSIDRLNRLPKCCIQNLYRALVCAPRDEAKCDMVSTLWTRYQYGAELWRRVPAEEEFAERLRAAKKAGQPAPRY